ncbi:MAG: PrsW family glutamic-type intramembrane protease [bacterium]
MDLSLLGRLGVSLIPVLAFLSILILLDSFKLIRFRFVLQSMCAGGLAALLSLLLNGLTFRYFDPDVALYSRYIAPVLEESCKALYLIHLIRSSRVGFMVDSAIHGFALGAGFACVENIYYLHSIADSNLLLWIIRGFGTAIMHGGTTAIFAVLARNAFDRLALAWLPFFLPALAAAIASHSFFNHFFLPPLFATLVLLIAFPVLMMVVFHHSENATRHWLEVGFTTDQELLELITTDKIATTRIGVYLETLRKAFPGEIVADMLCLLRLRLELSIKAKGLLLMREAGFAPAPDPEINKVFDELSYLQKSLGPTGMLAINSLVSATSRDLWQLQMLGRQS